MRHRQIRNLNNAFSAASDAAYFASDGSEFDADDDLRGLARWEDSALAESRDRRAAWRRGEDY
jgi:hypothetical protein